MVRESDLAWDSALDFTAASDGVGTVGDSIGPTTVESSTTTTPISRTAGRSSIAMVFVRTAGASIAELTLTPAALAGMTHASEHIPAHSAGSIMAELRDPTLSAGDPALAAASTEEAASMAAAVMAGAVMAGGPSAERRRGN